ncbi:MAG: glycosyltransferase family 9 protein [Acidobacteria bacterium]|nr:glycosyltransferase family 9 protein [Acidobacteriota bacterium]
MRKKKIRDYSAERIKKILIFRTDRMGDLIMTLPAMKQLREYYKDSEIVLVSGIWNEEIIKRTSFQDSVLFWNPSWISRGEGSHSFINLCLKAWKLRKSGFDLAVDFTSDVRINILMFLSGAKRRVGYYDGGGGALLTEVIEEKNGHRVEQNLSLVSKLVDMDIKNQISLEGLIDVDDKECEKLKIQLFADNKINSAKGYIIVHPWGGRPVKTWNISGYRELLSKLIAEKKKTVIITGGKGESSFIEEICNGIDGVINLAGKLNLAELICLIKGSALFISPDTGPMHLAVALGTKSITLFGPSDIKKYAPYGYESKHHVITAAGMDCLYCNKIRKPPKRCFTKGVAKCMLAIKSEEVFNTAKKILKN